MPKETRMTAEKLAAELCEQEGFDVKDASEFAEDMLTRLLAGQVVGEEDANNKVPAVIQSQKLRLRHWYILLVDQMPNVFNHDEPVPIPAEYGGRGDFIWELVRTIWIKGKSDGMLDKIERMLDGSVSGTLYDPEKDRRKEGKLIRTILTDCFFTGEASSLTNEEYASKLQISRSTLENKKQAGMAIFGILMWIYAVRREMEDIENGIIPRPEQHRWWMKYV